MKTAIRIFMLVMLTASLSSCEMISGWFDVEIDTTIEGDLHILTDATELKSTEDHGFEGTETIQVMNQDLVDYEDLIDNIRAESVTVRVSSVDSSGVIIKANSLFGISNPNANYTWELGSDWPIHQGSEIDLPAESYSVLNQILNEYKEHPVTVSADGTCNKGNVSIVFNYGIKVKVESGAL